MDSNIKKYCPNCSQLYKIQSVSPNLKGNIPLLLSCGHTMCENCVNNLLKFLEPIQCKICLTDMKISPTDMTLMSKNEITLHQLFPVNVFMLGELVLQMSGNGPHAPTSNIKRNMLLRGLQLSEAESEKEDFYIDLQAIIKSTCNTSGECMECHKTTNKMCQQCATMLCEQCFNKTHKTFIVFKNHVLKNIEPTMESNSCKTHKDKPLDYYCKDCKKSICLDCMMVGGEKSCKTHDVVSMQEVNITFLEDLTDITPKVDEIFKRMTKTAVDIGNILHNMENDTGTVSDFTQLLATIEQHFSKMFSSIQKHKQEVTDIITKLKCSEKESLYNAKEAIAGSIKHAKQVLNRIQMSSAPDYMSQMNLSTLLEDAKQVANTAWYLSRDETKTDPLKVTVSEDLCTLISDYIQLEGNAKALYKLRSTSEIGEDVELPPPPMAPVYPPELPKDVRQSKNVPEKVTTTNKGPTLYKQVPKYRSKGSSVSSLNSVDSDSSQKNYSALYGDYGLSANVQQVSPFPDSSHPKQLHEGAQELIYITHIVDPHNFFVQRACHQPLVKEMFREFRNAQSLPKPYLSHVAEGKNYLVFNKVDNMWQRCRVVSIDRKDSDKPKFHVFCIDFGSTEVVSIDKLRLLPPARVQSPYPLAINCKLANCVPKNGTWTSDDSFLIQNLIDNKQAVIHVRHIRSTSNYSVTLECDVTNFEDGVSVAHALVFHERAKMPDARLTYPKIMGTFERPRIFINNSSFQVNTTEEVYITHIVNPDNFYVRKRHLQNVFEKLCEDLQEYNLAGNTGPVYLPEIGMFCVVNLEKCRELNIEGVPFARAFVTELPGRGRVRVTLLDIGYSVLVHWTALRRLLNKFTTLRALATECHLAGVTPLNKKWSPKSVALLQKYMDCVLELHVENSKGSVGVTLYDKTDEDNVVCINKEMIKQRFAVSFGIYNFNKTPVEDQVFTNKSPLDKPKPPTPKPEQVKILKKNENIKENDLKAKDKGPLRLEAKVLNYQTPSLIYISLVHQQKTYNELFEKIQKFYTKNKVEGKSDWKVGDRCSTICKQSATWRRAAIIEIEDKNAKVFYSDFACVETVPLDDLKELVPEFGSEGDAAIKCHMSGIMPAIGEDWPSLTKETLKELLDVYKRIFITKRGNFKDKSMPVEMWVYHTIQGGALEANKSEWRCLNNKIVEQGLAIPDKSPEPTTSDGTSEIPNNETLSFLNITGSIHDWLQLEPLPLKPLVAADDVTSIQSSNDDENDQKHMAASLNAVFISDWLPPEPLPSKEFTGVPTYIDNDGLIYLHDIAQQGTLDLIRQALDVRFTKPDPKAKYTKWTVGEPCIAMFFLDNRFYRGRIMEVNTEKASCLVHYIDYGNEEWCVIEKLRKSICLHQIPVQAHKCILNRIGPIENQWPRQTLDYLHKFIVEKECYVKVTAQPIEDVCPIDLKYDKLWINDHLVEFEMAVYTDGTKPIVKKYVPKETHEEIVIESDSGPDYIVDDDLNTTRNSTDVNSMDGKDWNLLIEEELSTKFKSYPKHDFEEFTCNITAINDVNALELAVIMDDDLQALYDSMFEELQKEGDNLLPIDGIFEHKAIAALYPEDNQWYRASILQYSETKGRIKVRYVDYGNVEVISLSDVRELSKEFLELPSQCIRATLHDIKVNAEVHISVITKEYTDTFLDKGPFNVKIVKNSEPNPVVELRTENGDLVYQHLINNGVFQQCD